MTTYAELAKDPFAFDTKLAYLYSQLHKAQAVLAARIGDVYKAAGAHRVSTRHGVRWDADYATAHNVVRDAGDPRGLLARVSSARMDITEIELDIQAMDEAYTGWTRFFPSDTKSHPHIHRSLACHTLHATTVMRWAPELSGHTDAEAVDKLDEALCSVCFPGAPVALHNYVSKRSQAEQAERQAAKDDRAAKQAAKNLTTAEQDEMGRDHRGDRVTTVAALKTVVRDAVELAVELEYWTTHTPANWNAEQIARRIANTTDSLAQAIRASDRAQAILRAREARHEGWGAGAADIARMQDSKRKSATKEWAKI